MDEKDTSSFSLLSLGDLADNNSLWLFTCGPWRYGRWGLLWVALSHFLMVPIVASYGVAYLLNWIHFVQLLRRRQGNHLWFISFYGLSLIIFGYFFYGYFFSLAMPLYLFRDYLLLALLVSFSLCGIAIFGRLSKQQVSQNKQEMKSF